MRHIAPYFAVLHQYENGAMVGKDGKGIAFLTLNRWYTLSDVTCCIQTLEGVHEAVKETARHQSPEAEFFDNDGLRKRNCR